MAGRRSNHEGTLYKRKDGSWCAQITLPNGKLKTIYGKVQKEVRDWLVGERNAARQGMWNDNDSTTVGDFLERYLTDVVAHTLRLKTQESYFTLTRKHLIPELGKTKLIALQPNQLQALYSSKLNDGYSRRTVQYLHSILHKALSQAVKWGLVMRNVADAVDAPRPSKKAPEMLTEAQAKLFLESVRKEALYPLWLTLLATGMRKGEALGLRWEDLDLSAGIIHVTQTAMTIAKHGVVISEPKTEQSRRSIGVPPIVIDALKAHRQTNENELVFVTRNGTPYGSGLVLRYFHRALKNAGLPKVSLHSLRHLHATMLLKAGLHPKIVQSRLGHSQIGMTMDLYSHIMPGMDEKASVEMGRLLQ